MQQTSDLYNDIRAGNHWVETRLVIGENGRLITKQAERITFGGVGILTGIAGADDGYGETLLSTMTAENSLFSSDEPSVGCCVAGELDVKMIKPTGDIPTRARLAAYVRVTDGTRKSEWLPKGVYYVDTREYTADHDHVQWVTLHAYDAMILTEADYPSSTMDWPATDTDVLQEIANTIDVQIDDRTLEIMTLGYQYPYPAGYSMREVLSYIAASYCGSFTISDAGELRLVRLGDLPKETRNLVVSVEDRRTITFGGDRILV